MTAPVLIACEESGTVREALRRHGVDAVSCDVLPSRLPGPHIQGDAVAALRSRRWRGLFAFPPCTYIAGSGLHWNARVPGRALKTEEGLTFARAFIDGPDVAGIDFVSTENPVGILSTRVRKPDQKIQPYDFGEDASKKTCLWLKGFPPLLGTKFAPPPYGDVQCAGSSSRWSLGRRVALSATVRTRPDTSGGTKRPAVRTSSGRLRTGHSNGRRRIRGSLTRWLRSGLRTCWEGRRSRQHNERCSEGST